MLLLFILGFILNLSAQHVITGTITDGQTKETLPGVTIMIGNSGEGTITDIDGKYSLTANDADQLNFSYIGYVNQEILVGEQMVINLQLMSDVENLGELVVVGYGNMKKEDITGSVALVRAEDMKDRVNNQVGSLIQGKAAGVQVLSSSGNPAEGFSIRVRGTNSINASSEPLYVVDGVPTTDTRSINPSDIESLTVLKDASSAAIYGAQGANGVVIITTKRGSGDKPTLSFESYVGVSKVWNTLDVLNAEEYRDLMTEMGQSTNWEDYPHNTDWQDEIFQEGLSQNYQMSVSGQSNKTNYYVGAGWTSQNGAVRSSEMERGNFKINLDQEVNNWLKIGTRIAYTHYRDVDVNDNSGVGNGGVLMGALMTPAIIDIYNEDGSYTSNPLQNWENPIASTDGTDREYNKDRFLGNAFAEVKLYKDLMWKTNLGLDVQYGIYDSFTDPYKTSYGRANQGVGSNSTDKSIYYIFDNTLNYNKSFGNHKLSALAGSVIQATKWENSYIQTKNYSSDNISTPNAGSEIMSATAYKSEKANASFLGRINYDYQGKYLFTTNFRADGSSNFGPDNRWGFFPSFSGGWRLSEEDFLEDATFLSDLKLRIGWGLVGNDQIGTYAYFGRVGSGANYPIGGSPQPGTYPASIQNDNLKWEQSEQTNIGVDASFFQSRVRLSADAYIKNTEDLLINAPLPTSTGYTEAIQNIGQLQNKGLELLLSTDNLKDRAIEWTTDFNISFNRNEVIDLVGQELYQAPVTSRGDAVLVAEGLPLGSFYGYEWGGVDPTTGNAYYIAADGSSTFNPDPDTDRKVIGDPNPDFYYGFTNTLRYKSFSLSIFLEGKQGNDILNLTRMEGEAMTTPANQLASVNDRWKQPGDITDIPKASPSDINNSLVSTRFVEDGSYLRLKTLSLAYQLPTPFVNRLHLNGLRVYVTGENLFTITGYSGYDPEVNAYGSSNTVQGVDYGTYPQTRNFIFGVNITL